MKNKFAWLARLPEVDFFEIVAPDVQEIDNDDHFEYQFRVRLRSPQEYGERVHIVWREDETARSRLAGKRTLIVHAVYFDEQERPVFKSKPFRVRLKRRVH